jgi:hypothetical protein
MALLLVVAKHPMVTGQGQPITIKKDKLKLPLRPVKGHGPKIFIPIGRPDPKGARLLFDSGNRKV